MAIGFRTAEPDRQRRSRTDPGADAWRLPPEGNRRQTPDIGRCASGTPSAGPTNPPSVPIAVPLAQVPNAGGQRDPRSVGHRQRRQRTGGEGFSGRPGPLIASLRLDCRSRHLSRPAQLPRSAAISSQLSGRVGISSRSVLSRRRCPGAGSSASPVVGPRGNRADTAPVFAADAFPLAQVPNAGAPRLPTPTEPTRTEP
jgi:hypothetical protein